MSICGKCKADTTHVIVALVDEKPKRVECLACHALHNYRKPKTEAEKKAKATKKTRTPTKRKLDLSDENAVDYDPKQRYEADQVLRHKTFGLGLITQVHQTRIEVTFENRVSRNLIIIPAVEEPKKD